MRILQTYFKTLYQRTMAASYDMAFKEIANVLRYGGHCLDCGAGAGGSFEKIKTLINLDRDNYHGIEWNTNVVKKAQLKNLNVIQGDLNNRLPFGDESFRCVFALSVLEHLLFGCSFIKECYRTLEKDGTLILLTPNISTFFTIALLLLGKMPSSGPHPDSNKLISKQEIYKVSSENISPDTESETPEHRHLVVFSYRVLRQYLSLVGFSQVKGHGFGLYPFPVFLQPALERIDPYHCHQMVFIAKK